MIIPETAVPDTAFTRPAGDMVVVYDGECPFCSNFVQLQKLRDSAGTVTLVNARDHLIDVRAANAAGLDLDQGMLVFWQGSIYEGADAVRILARHGKETGFIPRLSRMFLSSEWSSRVLYPVLRAGRNAVLGLLGRTRLNAHQ